MVCRRIRAEDFRNIAECDIGFSDGINIIYGKNAQGKTNLLEAVCLFSLGKSFRGVKENEFIRFERPATTLGMDYFSAGRDQNIKLMFSRSHKRVIEKNGVGIQRMSELIGSFRAVLFFPEHLNIIKEGPSMRRSYLDVAISQLRPFYLKTLQQYNHILSQRNKLIKNAPSDRKSFDTTVEFWSYQLAQKAAYITQTRINYLEAVSVEVKKCFAEMTGEKEVPDLCYSCCFKIDEHLLSDRERLAETYFSQLMSNHDREIAFGATVWGTHKDDIDIDLNGKSARIYASQGQQRSLALSMKLAEGSISKKDTGEEPVLLLDDVFSELDASRREYLTEKMKNGQVIMTACGGIDPGKTGAKVIFAEDGRFSEQGSYTLTEIVPG